MKKKPFYLRQPWEILFRETKLDKISPWNINLVHLLTTLLEEMNKVGIDFRMAGTAINSSVYIYLKKAELLLKMEEPPEAPSTVKEFYLPPPLTLPFRFELTTTTVQDLITALEKALAQEGKETSKTKLPTLPPPIPDFLEMDAYLLEIEKRSEILLTRIQRLSKTKSSLTLFELVKGQNWLEVIRLFMMVLFLAQRGEIDLIQDEDETEINIKYRGV